MRSERSRVRGRRARFAALAASLATVLPTFAFAQASPRTAATPPSDGVLTATFDTVDDPYEVAAEPVTGTQTSPSRSIEHRCAAPCELRLRTGWWRVDAVWPDGTRRTELVALDRGRDVQRSLLRPSHDRPFAPVPTVTRVARVVTLTGACLVSAAFVSGLVLGGFTERGDPVLVRTSVRVTAVVAAVGTAGMTFGLLLNPFFDERPTPHRRLPSPTMFAVVSAGPDAAHVGLSVRF